MSQTWVALLRAINLGRHNKVPMAVLREAYTNAGCDRVATYIQSGNVVFASEEPDPARLAPLLEDAVRRACGVESPVVLRSAGEWSSVVGANPFADLDVGHLHVNFLATTADPAKVAEVERRQMGSAQVRVVGRDVYWYLPDGVQNARFLAAAERGLGTGTTRNWRTVLKITDMVAEAR